MAKKTIVGLKWAKVLDSRPKGIPVGKPRGAKAYGVRYERALASAAPWLVRGTWFEFEDKNGPGLCQTDFLSSGAPIVVLETKYTWTEDGHVELEKLYLPIVEAVWGGSPVGIVVSKNLTPRVPSRSICASFEEAIEIGRSRRSVLHWIGSGGGFGGQGRPLLAVGEAYHGRAMAASRSVE